MQMVQRDWLSHHTLPFISLQRLDVVNKLGTYALEEDFDKCLDNYVYIPERPT